MRLKHESYIVIAVVVGVAVVYTFAAFFPQMRAIRAVRQEICEKQQFIMQTDKLRPLLTDQQKLIAATEAHLLEASGILIAPENLSKAYGEISRLCSEAGTQTARFEPLAAETFDTFRKVPLGLSVTGSTHQIESLLASLEGLPQLIWVEKLRMDGPSEAGGNTSCHMDLALFVDNREISN
jgi:Tfp pilus assembly protein PilO